MAHKPQLVVERQSDTVSVTLRGLDPEEARRIYRAATAQAREGRVVLEVLTVPRPVIDHDRRAELIQIAPDARKGEEPCGECHLQPSETCNICGAVAP